MKRGILLSSFIAIGVLAPADVHAELDINPFPGQVSTSTPQEAAADIAQERSSALRKGLVAIPMSVLTGELEAYEPLPAEVYSEPFPGAASAGTPLVARSSELTPMHSESLLQARAGGWVAMQGQSLEDVLRSWSKRQGVDFIWDVPYGDLRSGRMIEVTGSYEDAVRALLEQFEGAHIRPVAQIYLPNETRHKTLVVSLAE